MNPSSSTWADIKVSDETDFPDAAKQPGLRLLDRSLRCPICHDFYDGPVTLLCGHCFCSVCLRSAMIEKQECPACRALIMSETHIRANPAVEEAVTAWREARDTILKLVEDQKTLRARNTEARPRKRRKLSDVAQTSAEEVDIPDSSQMPSSSSSGLEVANDPDDADCLVVCPLCHKEVRNKYINMHIDSNCTKDGISVSQSTSSGSSSKKKFSSNPSAPKSAKSDWSKIMGPGQSVFKKGKTKEESVEAADPVPTVSYDMTKEKKLRDILQNCGLPTSGDKATLIARHQTWRTIFNANLDKSPKNRKSTGELRRELAVLEDQRQREKRVQGKNAVQDLEAYQKQHKSDFAQLVKQARPKPKAPPDTREKEDDVIELNSDGEGS